MFSKFPFCLLKYVNGYVKILLGFVSFHKLYLLNEFHNIPYVKLKRISERINESICKSMKEINNSSGKGNNTSQRQPESEGSQGVQQVVPPSRRAKP